MCTYLVGGGREKQQKTKARTKNIKIAVTSDQKFDSLSIIQVVGNQSHLHFNNQSFI